MSPTNLTPSSLLELALTLLPSPTPPSSTEDASSSPPSTVLETPHQLLSLLLHSIHTATGFRTTPPSGNEAVPNQLKGEWNKGKSIQFQYRHDQSSLEFIVSCLEMGNRGMCVGVAVEDNKSYSFDLSLSDYFSASAFPLTLDSSSSSVLMNAFATPNRLADLISLYRINILQPLIPGLRKDGYDELASLSSTSATTSGASGSGSNRQPLAGRGGYYPDPGGPLPIPFGGEPRLPNLPPRLPNLQPRLPSNPLAIGSRDLDPLGGARPQFPLFPTGGPSSMGDPFNGGGGDGMMVGRDHPLFRERFGDGNNPLNGGEAFGGGMGGMGGNGMGGGMVPPGARFDPVGPFGGIPGRGRGGFGGGIGGRGGFGGGRGGGRGGFPGLGQRMGEPDWDDLRMPGNNNGGAGGGGNDYDAMFG